ncbi:type VI secretion system baseplate subunit TssE [Enterobacter cloacae]|jgi:type VI secretion system protein|uniref:type VI secretion system baseplate subunit TssE n=1 Tax=Enterobacter kobei TaxID=208224 RepID=UPI00101382CA
MSALIVWRTNHSASLFERIEDNLATRNSNEEESLVASLKRNLQAILNTRAGNAQSCKELGIIDFNDATGSTVEVYATICKAIRRCIENYEPRINKVDVVAQPNESDPLTLYFSIKALVIFDEKERLINFNLRIDGNHKYKID